MDAAFYAAPQNRSTVSLHSSQYCNKEHARQRGGSIRRCAAQMAMTMPYPRPEQP